MTDPCAARDRCKHVQAGGECVGCGGARKGTGIAGAASHVVPTGRPEPVCHRCGGPLSGRGVRLFAWIEPGLGVVQGCGRETNCRGRVRV
jgi:hypothetical protein